MAVKTNTMKAFGTNTVWIRDPMAFHLIEEGARAEICHIGALRDGVVYGSKVISILDAAEKIVSIHVPAREGRIFQMEIYGEYGLMVYTKTDPVRFRCRFEGYMQGEVYSAVLSILDEGIKLQRREFFRFTCTLAMKFSIMYTGDNEAARLLSNSGYYKMHNGIIRDIGGGGIRFISSEALDVGDNIQCTIMLSHTAMLIKGNILDKQYMPKSSLKFQYRVMFLDVTQATQDEIVNYIFAEQRKQRRLKQVPTSNE